MAAPAISSRKWVFAALLAALALGATGALIARARQERAALSIRLRWIRSYDKETWDQAQTGLTWTLSFLGARLERPLRDVVVPGGADSSLFELRLGAAGFEPRARRALAALLARMKGTGEYHDKGALDLGRFVALTLGDSWSYYAITGAPPTLDAFRAAHHLERAETFPVLNSDVARHSRVLRLALGPELAQLAFIAEELSGSFGAAGVRTLSHEVIDLMPNGQLRVGIYDERGRLSEGTPAALSTAGKPAKCLWCHEINLFSLFRETPDLPGYMTAASFSATMARAREVVTRQRQRLRGGVDFRRTQDHTQAELLYIAFMEPSSERLAREWGVAAAEVRRRLADRPTHVYAEFPFLGALYHRRFADAVAGYQSLPAPPSVRELAGDVAAASGAPLR